MDIDLLSLDWGSIMTPGIQKAHPKKDPRLEYKDVFRFQEYWPETFPHLDLFKTLRYIVMVYDSKSPIHTVFTDLYKIKVHAAELAGFIKQEDGRFLSNVEQMMACKDLVVNKMIIRYVVSNKSGLYSKFVLYQELHFVEMTKLLSGEKGTRVGDFDILSDKLDEVRQELFRKDKSIGLQEDFMKFYIEDKLLLKPEDIARKIKEGKEPVPAPLKKKSRTSAAKSSRSTKKKTNTASSTKTRT
jgi:hypothetical protein